MAWCSAGTSVLLENHRDWSRGWSQENFWERGKVVLRKLWPDSTGAVGVQEPWELCCPQVLATQLFFSMFLSQGSLGDALTFIAAVGSFCSAFPSFSCCLLLLYQSFSISLPDVDISPLLHSFLISYLYLPAIDLNIFRSRIIE